MAWSGQWSILVDGHALNTLHLGGFLTCECPEIGWVHEQEAILVPRDGDYPAFIGMQPREGNLTLNIQSQACDWGVWDTRLTQLKGWLTPGQHTFSFQVRGMPAAKTIVMVVKGLMDAPVNRRVTVTLVAPAPVLV